MYFEDHNPPHFHIKGNDGREAEVLIADLSVRKGQLDRRAMTEALDWAGPARTNFGRSGMPTTLVDIYDPFADEGFLTVERVELGKTPILRAFFSDGAVRDVDFSKVIHRNHWFAALAVPTTFETVEIISDGRGLQWITGVDFCVDALRIMADKQLHGRS